MNTEQGKEVEDANLTAKLQLEEALEQIDIAAKRLPTEQEQARIDLMCATARMFVTGVCSHIPKGKEREVAINNTISALLWARQGLVRGRVEMVAMP